LVGGNAKPTPNAFPALASFGVITAGPGTVSMPDDLPFDSAM
jgi:hypothetical protein